MGSTRAPRVDSGAPPESSERPLADRALGEGAQGGTRGRVRSPILLINPVHPCSFFCRPSGAYSVFFGVVTQG
jgi:hypothetical protein